MELQDLLRTVYDLLAEGQLEKALKLVDNYVFEKHADSNELVSDVIQLRRQLSTINHAKISHSLAYDDIRTQESQLTDSITVFLSLLRDFETNQAVKAEVSGHGLLMHNIPRRMAIGLPTRCTIRIGSIVEEIMRGMEHEEFATVTDIKVAKLMEVQLLSEQPGAFQITTVNRPEQEVDFETHSEWRYDVTPLLEGQYKLELKVSTVKFIDGKDRYAEKVYDITVLVETRLEHLIHAKAPAAADWQGVAVVEPDERKKTTPVIGMEDKPKASTTAIPPWLDMDKAIELPPTNKGLPTSPPKGGSGGPEPSKKLEEITKVLPQLVDVGPSTKSGSNRILTAVVSLIALGGIVGAAIWYFNRPNNNQLLTDATFQFDRELRSINVLINGQPMRDWSFGDDSSAIIVHSLVVGETYEIALVGENGRCSDKVNINQQQPAPYSLRCRIEAEGEAPPARFGLVIAAPYPFETLLLDGQRVEEARGRQEVKLPVLAGLHRVEAVFSDEMTSCEATEIEVRADAVLKLNCVRREPPPPVPTFFRVQLQVPTKVFRASGGRIRSAMDGALLDVQPIIEQANVFFNLPEVPLGPHRFGLNGVSDAYVCNEINPNVQGNMKLAFDCRPAVYEVTITFPPEMAKDAGQAIEIIVDGKSVRAVRQGRTTYILPEITHGSHQFELKNITCWICPKKIQTAVITASQRQLKFDCTCLK
ncbi:MAG: hypothetical protein K9J37_02375 [Saprospiraceae bacterium]|nr:hypothetical protein [Saprospiraceae bacterium]MCF8248725.1 hypothetical protein [Saprospiraceae bacterium]MCF8278785.1 hypothetical protein [Bacteroidales bacterium]MCF8310585.1 hypothetical protein [Saprospiraceae bacterium]MCF8439144.1 hypothetical protein [Saprospiraceae bacterium]